MKKTHRTVIQRMIPTLFAGAAIATVACSDSMTGITEEDALLSEVVLTQGTPAPEPGLSPEGPRRSDLAGTAPSELGGSTTSPVSLKPSSCVSGSSQQVTITYSITGKQDNPASFKVNTAWTYDGSDWGRATPTTVNVPARPVANADATIREVEITVANGSSANSGTSSFSIVPFDVSTTAPAALSVSAGNVTVNVAFVPCPSTNTPPTLVLPTSTLSVEATSSAGAAFNPLAHATANDLEDGDLTGSVICAPVAGTFALGEHTFECEVTDSGGLKTTGSFDILVEDTTPAGFTSIPSGTVNKIAQNASGWTFDAGAFGITVADVGGVSEPSTFSCTPVNGTALAIGSTTTVSCTAKDAIGNESAASTFDVFVTLDLSSIGGFLPPLRNASPFSTHKRGSTIPHKFPAPLYADGTPATDLASGLGLRLWWKSGDSPAGQEEAFDPAAGSTVWRYDDGHYVFNAKTANNWKLGTWGTEVKFAGIVLATTDFGLLK